MTYISLNDPAWKLIAESPRWRYLTNSYVHALGLERFPVIRRRNRGYVSHGLGGTLPRPEQTDVGVRLGQWLYCRAADGLSWDLSGQATR